MSQCLRCMQPCSDISLLCEECRAYLQHDKRRGETPYVDVSAIATFPLAPSPLLVGNTALTPPPVSSTGVSTEDISVREDSGMLTENQEPGDPADPAISTLHEVPEDLATQSLQNLSAAARLIAAADQSDSPHRTPRASRLAPLLDISADIQRDSTPLLRAEPAVKKTLADRLPDLWPWLQEADIDDQDEWADRPDPLLSRRFPSSSEHTLIQNDQTSQPLSTTFKLKSRRRRYRRSRILLCVLILLLILLVVTSSVLFSFVFLRNNHAVALNNQSPTLLVSKNSAQYGDNLTLRLRNFTPLARVFISRDIDEHVQIDRSNPVKVGMNGSADLLLVVENSWGPGVHMLIAEDIITRYTASTTLRVDDLAPVRPAHFIIDSSDLLKLGPDVQGANTIESLNLRNSGGSSIAWSASSDQPWLLITPNQGIFSASQKISIAAQRTGLEPHDYAGKITFSTNVGDDQVIQVTMTVNPLPKNSGAVLAIAPAALNFVATDGLRSPSDQFLLINNPGSAPLYWSINNNATSAGSLGSNQPPNPAWLSTDQTSGTVLPGSVSNVRVIINSTALLPGTYTSMMAFSASANHTALNSPQSVSVALTIQRRCSLMLNAGNLIFTGVQGQSNPSSQSFSLAASTSCAGTSTTSWRASSSASWLVVTPASGQLNGLTSSVVTVSTNTAGLVSGLYTGVVTVAVPQGTQTITVSLTIQTPPPPSAPVMNALPLNLNFTTTLGQANPPGQTVTLTNTGKSTLIWSPSVNSLISSWLSVTAADSTVEPGQTGTLTAYVNANSLQAGSYTGQILLRGTGNKNSVAGGSPQVVAVNLVVLSPCSISQPTSSELAFNATQGSTTAIASQAVSITAAGNCSWPVHWNAIENPTASWLQLAPTGNVFTSSGQTATINVVPNITGLGVGVFSTQISIATIDATGQPTSSNLQSFTVTLTVLQPCTLQTSVSNLNFTVTQGQTSAPQTLAFGESGTCARPINWTVSGDNGSSSWLQLSPASGSDSGTGGTIKVSVNAATLTPGTTAYTGTISLSTPGIVVQGSPLTISVNVSVIGFTVSGTVQACSSNPCGASPPALASATVNLLDSNGGTVVSVPTDANGNFSMGNVPNGSYTLSVSGTDSANIIYTGSQTINVSGVVANIVLPAYAPVVATPT